MEWAGVAATRTEAWSLAGRVMPSRSSARKLAPERSGRPRRARPTDTHPRPPPPLHERPLPGRHSTALALYVFRKDAIGIPLTGQARHLISAGAAGPDR
jgi:hypothetical protein